MSEPHALCATLLEEHIRKLVDAAPPLTDEQRVRLAMLLVGPGRRDLQQGNKDDGDQPESHTQGEQPHPA